MIKNNIYKFVRNFIYKLINKDRDVVGVIVYVFYDLDEAGSVGIVGNMYSEILPTDKYKCNHALKLMVNKRAAEDY